MPCPPQGPPNGDAPDSLALTSRIDHQSGISTYRDFAPPTQRITGFRSGLEDLSGRGHPSVFRRPFPHPDRSPTAGMIRPMAHPATSRELLSAQLKIGLEVHVELATRTKMWTRCPNAAHPDQYEAAPNSLVDPVVAALPGTLPVMNLRAVEMSVMVGLALGCTIAPMSRWDRKNYFYPDLPKGYQISQYDLPLCSDGVYELTMPGSDDAPATSRRIGITRCHLEEDTGKLGHELPGGQPYEGSLVDLNRAGTPLLEIVTQPDFRSAEEVVAFARELRQICRALRVTEGIMQRGHMRFEPNINVIIETADGRTFATPVVEVKNLNSFRAVRGAIEHEAARQVSAWREDGLVMGPGRKSTRGWDDQRGVTLLQREKEDAHDYRYFPDPDLVPVVVDDAWLNRIRATLPELPNARIHRYVHEYSLARKDAASLAEEIDVCTFFEHCITVLCERSSEPESPAGPLNDAAAARAIAKLLLNAGAKRANESRVLLHELGISPQQIADIVLLRDADQIGSSAADELFGLLCERDDDAAAVAQSAGLLQVRDDGLLAAWVSDAIASQPQAAQDFRDGKDSAVGRLVGTVMKLSNGTADAKAVREQLIRVLRAGP